MKINGTKTLVVDDEIGYRNVLYNSLREHGLNVKTVASGEEALEELKKQEFHIILTDMKLPGGLMDWSYFEWSRKCIIRPY